MKKVVYWQLRTFPPAASSVFPLPLSPLFFSVDFLSLEAPFAIDASVAQTYLQSQASLSVVDLKSRGHLLPGARHLVKDQSDRGDFRDGSEPRGFNIDLTIPGPTSLKVIFLLFTVTHV